MALTPLHDGLLVVAFGRSRYETSWKSKEITWSDLVKRFSKTVVTSESYAEYLNFKSDLQDEKKDVGGFVGGLINGGHRKIGAVTNRSLLTLDVDFGGPGFWDEFRMAFPNAGAIYGTHKHHPPDAYRYRLIVPLSRPVLCDEYQAIARKIAEILDIEVFDITTYQPERLMYWPSISRDSVFYSKWQDGPWIDPDTILAMYPNWTDASQWPIAKREKERIHTHGAKQGDPLDKPGVIGAFNRVYDIVTAIEAFLSDVYEPTDDAGRWSYLLGSTSGGLVIYEEGLFAYSHHGTDPVSGKLCSAFDLVRLHKFGKLDEGVKEGTPINKYPSHIEMERFAAAQAKVRIELIEQHEKEIEEDFADLPGEFTPSTKNSENGNGVSKDELPLLARKNVETVQDDKEWKGKLEVDKQGRVLPTIPNLSAILQHDVKLMNAIGWDDFTHLDTCLTNLPWRNIKEVGEPFAEVDMSSLRHYIERKYKTYSPPRLKDSFLRNRIRVSYHPICNYLNSLEWDGSKRVDTLLMEYLNAKDDNYTRIVTRKSLVACVARVFNPGVKFDNVLTLVGEEGLYKSTLFKTLGRQWFSDSLGQIDNPKIFEQLQGAWIIEMGELSALRRAEVEMVKHFISKSSDRFRVAYGTHVENFPRQCVFFATTNNKDFLSDNNGNRRFWPVDVSEGGLSSIVNDLPNEVDQIWAEVLHYYHQGETLFLTKEQSLEAVAEQQGHTEFDHREEMIRDYLETPNEETDPGETGELKQRVSVLELWSYALGGMRKDLILRNTKDIHKIMKRIEGWKKFEKSFRNGEFGVQSRGYERIEPTTKLVE